MSRTRRTPATITRAEYEAADRKVRAEGWKYKPQGFVEAIAYAVCYPDCSPLTMRTHKQSADAVIDGRGRHFGARERAERREWAESRGVYFEEHPWRADAYWMNFVPRARCSWRPTAPFAGRTFNPRTLP